MVASVSAVVRAAAFDSRSFCAIGYVHRMVLCTCNCKLINVVNKFYSYANRSVSVCRLRTSEGIVQCQVVHSREIHMSLTVLTVLTYTRKFKEG